MRRLAVQHRRLPIPVASRDTLCPPPPRAREAELPTAKGEGGGPGVSVGDMVGVVSGGGVVGCPCGLGLARRWQLALISMFAYISQRQNGPLWRTKQPCAWFRTSSTRGDRWGPPNVLPNTDILNPIAVPIRMYSVHPYWDRYWIEYILIGKDIWRPPPVPTRTERTELRRGVLRTPRGAVCLPLRYVDKHRA